MIAAAWSEALVAIPDGWLERAVLGALGAQRGSYMITTGDVLAAWDELLLERQQASAQTDPARLLPPGPAVTCDTCKGKHWLVDRAHLPAGQRRIVPCPDCEGQSEPDGARAREEPSYLVGNILPVLQAFCQEHNAPLPLPTRLEYALECARVGLFAETIRPLLEATEKPTLYEALIDLGVPVKSPPAPVQLRAEGPQPAAALF